MFETLPGIAGGTIRPARFIKQSAAADATFLEANANEWPVGISAEGPRDAPLDGASGDIASATHQFEYYSEGRVCVLEIGGGGVTRGAAIKSDADGKGVLAATTGTTEQNIGAYASESALEGELCRVLVKIHSRYPALS